MLRGSLVMLLVIVFLKKKVRSREEEGVWWLFGGDGWNGVVVLRAEAAQHVQDLASLADRLPDIMESVGQLLEVPGILHDVHVALNQVPELGL